MNIEELLNSLFSSVENLVKGGITAGILLGAVAQWVKSGFSTKRLLLGLLMVCVAGAVFGSIPEVQEAFRLQISDSQQAASAVIVPHTGDLDIALTVDDLGTAA